MPGVDTEKNRPDLAEAPTRYGFGHLLGESWTLLRANARWSLTIFCGVHLAAAAVSFLILLALVSPAPVAVFAGRIASGVIVPTFAGSICVALLTKFLLAGPAGVPDEDPPSRGTDHGVLVMASVASGLALVAVIFLGGYGVVLLPFFYGPPIAMQILLAENATVGEALGAARERLRGNWHTIVYLFGVAVASGILALVPVGALFSLAANRGDLPTVAAVTLGRGALVGLFATFAGVMQVTLYLHLRDKPAVPTGEGPIPG